ncbi:hypothetical protein ACNFBT_22715 [Pseudomonas sp. NY15181]|uniref:hypothetical protein n=1 Tax=Pseudomonas sp. NY15181 TaxID=3400349 RepID=UPI003A865FDD
MRIVGFLLGLLVVVVGIASRNFAFIPLGLAFVAFGLGWKNILLRTVPKAQEHVSPPQIDGQPVGQFLSQPRWFWPLVIGFLFPVSIHYGWTVVDWGRHTASRFHETEQFLIGGLLFALPILPLGVCWMTARDARRGLLPGKGRDLRRVILGFSAGISGCLLMLPFMADGLSFDRLGALWWTLMSVGFFVMLAPPPAEKALS